MTYTSCQDVTDCDSNDPMQSPLKNIDKQNNELLHKSTKVKKEVWIESDCLGLRSAIKKFGIDRFKKNCVTATEGFEYVLNNKINTVGKCQNSTKNSNNFDTVIPIKSSVTSSIDVTTGTRLNSCSNNSYS